jgi:hypothetical protein
MSEWMDEWKKWVDEWMGEWKDGEMGGWLMDGWIDGKICGQTDSCVGGESWWVVPKVTSHLS